MFTFDDQTVSDLHKDARGFRPHAAFMEGWNSSDDENKQDDWYQLPVLQLRRESLSSVERRSQGGNRTYHR